jgi:phage protein U
MWRENGLEYYKHIDTRRYLILDAEGRSYVHRDGETVRIDFQKEFRRVVQAIDARSVR